MAKRTNGHEPTYTLGIPDRIQLLGILPAEGDVITLKVVRDLRYALGLSEEELKQGSIKTQSHANGTTSFSWDATAVATMTKDIEVGEKALDVIEGALESLASAKKLPGSCLALYERFVEHIEPEEGKEVED